MKETAENTNNLDRRSLIRGIGAAIMAGSTPPFLSSLLPEPELISFVRGESIEVLESGTYRVSWEGRTELIRV